MSLGTDGRVVAKGTAQQQGTRTQTVVSGLIILARVPTMDQRRQEAMDSAVVKTHPATEVANAEFFIGGRQHFQDIERALYGLYDGVAFDDLGLDRRLHSISPTSGRSPPAIPQCGFIFCFMELDPESRRMSKSPGIAFESMSGHYQELTALHKDCIKVTPPNPERVIE